VRPTIRNARSSLTGNVNTAESKVSSRPS
jgi:hypothetical protein